MDKESRTALLQYLQDLYKKVNNGNYAAQREYISILKDLSETPEDFCIILADLPSMPDEVIENILLKAPTEAIKGTLIKAIISNADAFIEYTDSFRSFPDDLMPYIFEMKSGVASILKLYVSKGFWMNAQNQQRMLRQMDNNLNKGIIRSYVNGPNTMDAHWLVQLFMLGMPDAKELLAKYTKKGLPLQKMVANIAKTRGLI